MQKSILFISLSYKTETINRGANASYAMIDKMISMDKMISKSHIFLDEFGEEALGLYGGDVSTVVSPHQNPTLYVQ